MFKKKLSQKLLGKKMGVKNFVGSKKIWIKTNFWVEIFFGSIIHFGQKKLLGSKKNWVKNIFGKKNIWVQKIFG